MTEQLPMSQLRVTLLSSIGEVEALANDWNRLSRGIPFRRWEWHRAWWRHYGHDQRLFVLVVHSGEQVVGITPWYAERVSPIGSVIRFLGSGEACSDYLSILVDDQFETDVINALADWLTHCSNLGSPETKDEDIRWDLMELSGVDYNSKVTRSLVHRLESLGFTTHERTIKNCWRVPLPRSFEEYLASLSKPNRRRVRWSDKRLGAIDCSPTFVTTTADFEQTWESFVDLHQRRRLSIGDSGCFSRESFSDFLHDAAADFLVAGCLEFASVAVNSRTIATELCFRGKETTFAYQIGIDPDALKENPGWLVNTLSIRKALATGQSGFDLCRGDEEYKRHLGAHPEPCLEYRVVPPRFRAQLWHKAWVTGTTMKELIKNGLSITGIR